MYAKFASVGILVFVYGFTVVAVLQALNLHMYVQEEWQLLAIYFFLLFVIPGFFLKNVKFDRT
ncbi:hypothetical protein FLK61_41345 [Paenalkalicoccus suaedae]|uniref:Uncharacterized protein n=1 Tax=Paenalkalicoccus suaedae TaxID=2592382 RepID=A0A859FJR9_9BACI|nr:hypothetical protein [Paenalkalicoccus suaedae]QKS73039.1 hypothetical protein FLK61_41345 [Paenalkalicoccus suaedae]